ncbi:hypothetical protein [Micromonospora sp. NPDC023814]|uniref:hypothetical protein n=1 Tax=Micromonospora sp. NPDC023814 TaxID=3154596 RepID=UPI0033DBE582
MLSPEQIDQPVAVSTAILTKLSERPQPPGLPPAGEPNTWDNWARAGSPQHPGQPPARWPARLTLVDGEQVELHGLTGEEVPEQGHGG